MRWCGSQPNDARQAAPTIEFAIANIGADVRADVSDCRWVDVSMQRIQTVDRLRAYANRLLGNARDNYINTGLSACSFFSPPVAGKPCASSALIFSMPITLPLRKSPLR